ncbi:MAG: amidohydrolase family protein, partial [Bacteroidota bacterium]
MRLLWYFSLMLILMSCSLKRENVDVIIHNAQIHSMNSMMEVHQAAAVKDGKIVEIGPERQILNKYRSTHKIDLAGKHVYPGFIDAHCHFLGYGRTLHETDLSGTNSWEEVLDKLKTANKTVASNWIIGRGWDQNDWKDQEFPTKAKLDSLFPKNPVILTRVDGHTAIVNSVALLISGIDEETIIEGGQIVKDEKGQLTGLLIDNAMTKVKEGIFESSAAQNKIALEAAQKACFAVGLTTVTDAGLTYEEINQIKQFQEDGSIKMRVYAMASDLDKNFDYFLENGPIDTDHLTVRSFKFYADGTLGSRSA